MPTDTKRKVECDVLNTGVARLLQSTSKFAEMAQSFSFEITIQCTNLTRNSQANINIGENLLHLKNTSRALRGRVKICGHERLYTTSSVELRREMLQTLGSK